MKAVLGVALVGVVLAVPASAEARPLPYLSTGEAVHYMKKALKRKFGNAYRWGYAKEIHCSRRIDRKNVRCQRIQWIVGDVSYQGKGRIWFTRGRRPWIVWWNYAYRIKETNEFCQVTGGSNCVKIHKVD